MSFELLTFPCGEILKLGRKYMTRFQYEYISIHRPKTRILCDAFIVYMGLYNKNGKQ